MKGQVRDEWLYLTLIRLENVALIIIIFKIVFFIFYCKSTSSTLDVLTLSDLRHLVCFFLLIYWLFLFLLAQKEGRWAGHVQTRDAHYKLHVTIYIIIIMHAYLFIFFFHCLLPLSLCNFVKCFAGSDQVFATKSLSGFLGLASISFSLYSIEKLKLSQQLMDRFSL